MARIELQRPRHQLFRLAGKLAVPCHRQRIGMIGEQAGIRRQEGGGTAVGLGGVRVPSEHRVRPRQHPPALAVVGAGLQAGDQLVDHALDLFLACRVLFVRHGRTARLDGAGAAQPKIEADGQHGNAEADHGGQRRPPRSRDGHALPAPGAVLQRAALKLRLFFRKHCGIQQAGVALGIELAQLLAQHGDAQFAGAAQPRIRILAHQRAQQQRHYGKRQQRGKHRETDHEFSPPREPSRLAACRCSLSLSCATAWLERLRSLASRNARATISSRKGPPHSSQVVLFTGGR